MHAPSLLPNASEPGAERGRRHGGLQLAELRALGLDPASVLDFSSSTNPYGPDPEVLRALHGAVLERYPDSSALAAREALGRRCEVGPERIVLGNGAAELLWNLARCLVPPGTPVLIVEPTFSEFRAAAHACGAALHEWRSRPQQAFQFDLPSLSARVRAARARVVYWCCPSTPVGAAVCADAIAAWAGQHPGTTLVLDQSFLSLSERWQDAAVQMPENVVCVRSLTKDHGIPGVRVGYLIAPAELCQLVEENRPAWSTSAYAQAAAIACSSSERFVRESRERLLGERRELARELAALGLESMASHATFLIARIADAAALRWRLLAEHQISVRDCASFGLPDFIRLAARPARDRERLLNALRLVSKHAPRPALLDAAGPAEVP